MPAVDRPGTTSPETTTQRLYSHLQNRIDEVNSALTDSKLPFGAHSDQLKGLDNYPFREDPAESKVFWDVRKGLIPIVGGGREAGESSAMSVRHECPQLIACQCQWQDSMVHRAQQPSTTR
jgi:hypothetical protein